MSNTDCKICGISGCSNEASGYCHSGRCGLHCTMKGCSRHDNDDLPEPEPKDYLDGDDCYNDLPDDECGAKNGKAAGGAYGEVTCAVCGITVVSQSPDYGSTGGYPDTGEATDDWGDVAYFD